jgi:FAD/FMN-containing dehydrogenase
MNADDQAARELVHELQKAVGGEVRADRLTRQLYSTDASDYCKVPVGVVIPRDGDDIQAAMEIAAHCKVAIIPRGGGSSLSGQTVGTGLIINHSKYLDNILEINPEEKWMRVESGVVLDCLNAALASHDLMVGPDPSSSSVATLGGMAGNNSTGAHSFKYGMIADHILEMEVVLSDGSKATLDAKDAEAVAFVARKDSLEGRLYQQIPQLVERYREDIRTGYPKTWRNVAGYRLNRLLADKIEGKDFNLAQLIAGSEGSQAEMTHRIEAFKAWLGRNGYAEPITHCATAEQMGNVWQIRKSVLGLLLSKPGDDKPIGIIDDATVPVERLAA